jgi:hypothetical protein
MAYRPPFVDKQVIDPPPEEYKQCAKHLAGFTMADLFEIFEIFRNWGNEYSTYIPTLDWASKKKESMTALLKAISSASKRKMDASDAAGARAANNSDTTGTIVAIMMLLFLTNVTTYGILSMIISLPLNILKRFVTNLCAMLRRGQGGHHRNPERPAIEVANVNNMIRQLEELLQRMNNAVDQAPPVVNPPPVVDNNRMFEIPVPHFFNLLKQRNLPVYMHIISSIIRVFQDGKSIEDVEPLHITEEYLVELATEFDKDTYLSISLAISMLRQNATMRIGEIAMRRYLCDVLRDAYGGGAIGADEVGSVVKKTSVILYYLNLFKRFPQLSGNADDLEKLRKEPRLGEFHRQVRDTITPTNVLTTLCLLQTRLHADEKDAYYDLLNPRRMQ